MTAQILPTIVASPFSRYFDIKSNIFCPPRSSFSHKSTTSSASPTSIVTHQDCDNSSDPMLFTATPPVRKDRVNEKLPRIDGHFREPSQSAGRIRSSCVLEDDESVHPLYAHKVSSQEPRCSNRLLLLNGAKSPRRRGEGSHETPQVFGGWHKEDEQTAVPCKRSQPARSGRCRRGSSSIDLVYASGEQLQHSHGSPADHFEAFGPSFDLSHELSHEGESSYFSNAYRERSDVQMPSIAHKKRHSTASSGLVHTMKTASLSNASFSMFSRSLRAGRSTDSSLFCAPNQRRSVESDRPPTSSSVDEATRHRAVKRRQILTELIMTEESYIADLKALIYLYSTLLASTVAVSSRFRCATLRNIHELLHGHERLLQRLHQSSYQAAARKSANATSAHNSGQLRHRRWKSVEYRSTTPRKRNDHLSRNSIDSSNVKQGHMYLGSTEPQDVADVAIIFRNTLNDFMVYEEYCANHGLITGEMQHQAPDGWSTFESGIESLARSLTALEQRRRNEKKGLTVGDLLIKPIQRMTKYPLLFEDLLKQTPVSDCPSAHKEIEATLTCLKEVVQTINKAAGDHETRQQIQRRSSLLTKLTYGKVSLDAEKFRLLGNVQLCGVLYVTWQTRNRIDGRYALCVLFDSSMIIAFPAGVAARYEVVAFLHLSDIRVESPSDGRGLQCHSSLHTWKICFQVSGHLHEFILSACSSVEENAWRAGLQSKEASSTKAEQLLMRIPSSTGLDLRSIAMVYSQQTSMLCRNPSVQRAATVGNRGYLSQVIIRNTHNPQDLHEFRQPTTAFINRSQSHMTSNKIVILCPKRSERARLETALNDVWTKENLPYPGIIGSRGGQIIRASAGSLVRKLSLASIHGPFSRRSGSLSLSSRKSYDTSTETRRSGRTHSTPIFEIRKESFDELTPARKQSHEVPELDTMDSVISRMIGNRGSKRLSTSQGDHSPGQDGVKGPKRGQQSLPDQSALQDPADVFYPNSKEVQDKQVTAEQGLDGRKKRWSNPLGILKVLSANGYRHILYSSK